MNSTHILIVEDNVSLVEALQAKLLSEDFTVSVAQDGQQGLAMALHKHPDLILLDIMMPTMDGSGFMQELRKDAWGKHAPVIILTNMNVNDARTDQIIAELPAFYLVKTDVSMQAIVDKIRERLA